MVLKRIALTGSTGLVGRHVLSLCAKRGIQCAASSRRQPEGLPGGSSWVRWDLADPKAPADLDRLFPGVEAIIHLGAIVPGTPGEHDSSRLRTINVAPVEMLSAWARATSIRVVFLSSATVYAEPERTGIREGDPLIDVTGPDGYASSKRLAEQALADLPEAIILRPSSIYGAGLSPGKMIMKFLDTAREGMTIRLEPPFDDRIDLLHADDVAAALIDAATAGGAGVFNIASEQLTSIEEIARACVAVAHRGSVKLSSAHPDRSPVVRFGLSCEKARRAFGFRANVSLKEGLERTARSIPA